MWLGAFILERETWKITCCIGSHCWKKCQIIFKNCQYYKRIWDLLLDHSGGLKKTIIESRNQNFFWGGLQKPSYKVGLIYQIFTYLNLLKTDIQFNYCIQNFLANILVNNSGICPKQNIFDTGIISELPNILRQEIEEMNTKMLHNCHNQLQNNCSGDLNHHFLSKSTAKIVDVWSFWIYKSDSLDCKKYKAQESWNKTIIIS